MQADKEKKVKKKKASSKDETPAETPTPSEAPAETPASAATPSDSQRGSTRGSSSRRAKKAPSSVFVLFSQKQIAEFKEVISIYFFCKKTIKYTKNPILILGFPTDGQ